MKTKSCKNQSKLRGVKKRWIHIKIHTSDKKRNSTKQFKIIICSTNGQNANMQYCLKWVLKFWRKKLKSMKQATFFLGPTKSFQNFPNKYFIKSVKTSQWMEREFDLNYLHGECLSSPNLHSRMPATSKNLKQLNFPILFIYVYHDSVYDILAVLKIFLNVSRQW